MTIKRIKLGLMLTAMAFGSATAEDQSVERSVVFIKCVSPNSDKSTQGTGVLVSPYGHVLTAKHVVPQGYKCKGVIGTAAQDPARNLQRDPRLVPIDAALLRFIPGPGETFPFVSYRKLDGSKLKGNAITVSGFPQGGTGEIVTHAGTLSSTIANENGIVATDALTSTGMSGGPVLLKSDHHLIGIIAGADFDPSTGAPASYGVLSVETIADQFKLTLADDDAAQGNNSSNEVASNEKEFGPIQLAPGESKSFPLRLTKGGPVDLFVQSLQFGQGSPANAVYVKICSADESAEACEKTARQMEASQALRKRLEQGPAQASIFNFSSNPNVTISFRIAQPF